MNSRTRETVESSGGSAGRTGAPPSLLSTVGITVLLAVPALLLHLSPDATTLLSYDRGLLADGEWWRTITCHWTHWSTDHLRWDLLAFVALVPLCWRLDPRRLVGTLLCSSLLIPATVWLAHPWMVEYRGLSGLDSALFVLLGVTLLREELASGSRRCAAIFALALLGLAAKLAFEWIQGSTVFVSGAEFVPVPLAHAAGGLCGLLFAFRDRAGQVETEPTPRSWLRAPAPRWP